MDPFGLISRWSPGQVGGGADAVGLYRRSQASTELRIEGGSALPAFRYGQAPEGSTLPVAGDWNGDGTDTVGIYRRLDATFHLRDEAGKTAASVPLGTPGDTDVVPVAGDWNGDGRDSVGLYRRADATFVVRDDVGGRCRACSSAGRAPADVLPVVGDWDGDGRDSFGLYRTGDEALPSDASLMVDALQRWTLDQAVVTADRLGDLDLVWIEDPMIHADMRATPS